MIKSGSLRKYFGGYWWNGYKIGRDWIIENSEPG